MKILLTGSDGQLGQQIINLAPKNIELICLNRNKLNLTNSKDCYDITIKENPDWIINAGAYTNVDEAEKNKELTLLINSNAPLAFSKALKITGGKLLQISTDYVFNGLQNFPYATSQKRDPINYYGYTKGLAEENIENIFGATKKYIILRTSWVVGPTGKNFLLTMLSLHKNKEKIRVVCDQIGSLTSTFSLANACWRSIENFSINSFDRKNSSILHFSDKGITSWFDVAIEIGKKANKIGLLSKTAFVDPIKSSEYPTVAKRPNYSVLECTKTYEKLGIEPINWKKSIEDIIRFIKVKKLLK